MGNNPMPDFDNNNLLEDDKIEISDLDSPTEQGNLSRLQRLLKFVEAHSSSRTRTTLFVLLLTIGGCTLIYSIVSYLHIPIMQQAIQASSSTASIGITADGDITIESFPPNSLSVVNGIVYMGTPDGMLSARQADDGTALWQTKTAIPFSPPVVADNTIYITSENSHDGHIDAFRASDGNLQWSYQTQLLASQPIQVEGGIVYVGTQAGTIYALRASDGKLLWHFTVGKSTSVTPLRLETLLRSSDGVTIIRSDNQVIYFLGSQDGSELWHYPVDMNTPLPHIENGIVYLNYRSLQARRLGDGKLLWQYAADYQSSTIQHGIIYLNVGNQTVLTLNAQNGSRLWQFQTHQQIDTLDVQNGMVLLTMLDGTVTTLKDQSGSLLWQFKPPTPSTSFWLTSIQDEVLYVSQNAATVTFYALQANNGHTRWHQSVQNIDQSYSPGITNGLIYAKQADGNFTIWSSNDGHLIWHAPSSTSIIRNLIEVNGLVYFQQPDGSIRVLHIRNGKVAWRYPVVGKP